MSTELSAKLDRLIEESKRSGCIQCSLSYYKDPKTPIDDEIRKISVEIQTNLLRVTEYNIDDLKSEIQSLLSK